MSHDTAPFQPALAALAADLSTEFGQPGAQVTVLRCINGRYSDVAHVSIQTSTRPIRAYIKVLKPRMPGAEGLAQIDRMLKREYLATRAMYEAVGADPAIGAVRPIAWLPELRTLVTEEVPGRVLADVLLDGRLSTADAVRLAAGVNRWVRVYQSIGTTGSPISIAERRAYLDTRLAMLEGRAITSADRRSTLARFDRLASEIGTATVPAVRIHADLTPSNIIVGDHDRVTVLDFTMAKDGPSTHDLGHLYQHMDLMAVRHPARAGAIRAFQSALLGTGPGAATPDDPLFKLLLLQHSVCHVALIAERRVPLLDALYRRFLRRRWRQCVGEDSRDNPSSLIADPESLIPNPESRIANH